MSCNHKLKEENGDYCEICEVYKQPCEELFHVFTDGKDEWVRTEKEARQIACDWLKEYGKHASIRIYHETEWNEDEGIFEDGDCIYSRGSYPF